MLACAAVQSISKAVISGVCFPANYYTTEAAGSFLAAAETEVDVSITKSEIAGCVDAVDYYTPQYLAKYRN